MRKLLAIILAFLYFLMSTACAESDTEILFRNIPWGITLDEYVRELESQGFKLSSAGKNITYASLLGIEHPEYFCVASYGSDSSPWEILCQVAGYNVYGMSVYSVCDIQNGEINTDFLDSVVFGASYILLAGEEGDNAANATLNDLREKLSYLYGNETTTIDELRRTRYYWQGQNETGVELMQLVDGVGFMYITYIDKSIENHFEKLNSIVYEQTVNLDGL